MKKIVLLTSFIFFLQSINAQISISSSNYFPFVNEVIEIKAKVPGDDIQAPVKVIISNVTYKVLDKQISEMFYFNEITNKSDTYLEYTYTITVLEPGSSNIYFQIDKLVSDTIQLKVENIDFNRETPFLQSKLSNNTIYQREKAYVTNTVFSTQYIDDVNYTRPLVEMNATSLQLPSRNKIIINNTQGQYRIVSAFSLSSNTPGTYTIPESQINLYGIQQRILSQKITVIPLPKNTSEETIIGKTLDIKITGLSHKYNYGDNISFNITLSGNANLSELESLKEYFNFPAFVNENLSSKREFIQDGKLQHDISFNYTGNVNSIVGLKINKIAIPFFNTDEKLLETISIKKRHIPGNISLVMLYVGIIIIFLVVLSLIIFTIKFLKRIPKESNTDPVEKFRFSNREKEIFTILVNGKSTKEIAEELYISPETVKKHIQNILKKTNTNSRLELLALVNNLN